MRKPDRNIKWRAGLMFFLLPLAACAGPVPIPTQPVANLPLVSNSVPDMAAAMAPPIVDTSNAMRGYASWYRTGRNLHITCNGERLNNKALTAAATNIPVGTIVRVTRVDTGASVVVRINDYMPPCRRMIDLTIAAASQLHMIRAGSVLVTITSIQPTEKLASR